MIKPFSSRTLAASLLGFAFMATPARGQFVLSPVAVSTTIPSFNDTVSPTNLINQSGITTPFTSGVTVFDTYFANTNPPPFATSGNGGRMAMCK